jgi:hypothetical protein
LLLQVIRLKAALNEKDMELIELREQHMQLVVSSKAVVAVTQCNNPQWQGTLLPAHGGTKQDSGAATARLVACRLAGKLAMPLLIAQLACSCIFAYLLPVQARSQEARSNWETALDTKDRAITQLEEALESSKRALVRRSSSSA